MEPLLNVQLHEINLLEWFFFLSWISNQYNANDKTYNAYTGKFIIIAKINKTHIHTNNKRHAKNIPISLVIFNGNWNLDDFLLQWAEYYYFVFYLFMRLISIRCPKLHFWPLFSLYTLDLPLQHQKQSVSLSFTVFCTQKLRFLLSTWNQRLVSILKFWLKKKSLFNLYELCFICTCWMHWSQKNHIAIIVRCH